MLPQPHGLLATDAPEPEIRQNALFGAYLAHLCAVFGNYQHFFTISGCFCLKQSLTQNRSVLFESVCRGRSGSKDVPQAPLRSLRQDPPRDVE